MTAFIGRREFMALLGGAAAAWPLAARAQQAAKTTRLGVLLYSTPQAESQVERVRSGLRELGYIEGRNLFVSYYYAEGKPERLPDLAAALVRESPDLLLALGGDVAPHAAKATSTIPIVFVMCDHQAALDELNKNVGWNVQGRKESLGTAWVSSNELERTTAGR